MENRATTTLNTTDECYRPPKRTLRLWQVRVAVVTLGVMALAGATTGYFVGFGPVAAVTIAAVAAIGCLTAFFYLPVAFRHCRIIAGDDAVIVKRGVLFQVTYLMPYPRLIYAQSFSTPLSAAFHLKGIVLKAARGFIVVPEISEHEAQRLLDGFSRGRS